MKLTAELRAALERVRKGEGRCCPSQPIFALHDAGLIALGGYNYSLTDLGRAALESDHD